MSENYNYIGKGIYTIPDAVRLLKIDSRRIRRWVLGYKYKDNKKSQPLFLINYKAIEGKIALSFLDLIELKFVDAFQKYGISLNSIRIASKKAAVLFQSDHPFCMKKFYTEGKTIIAETAKDEKDIELLDLLKDQKLINEIISPCLYECLDFTDYDFPTRWWPLGRSKNIVIDPQRNWGQPVVNQCNIPTSTLMHAYKNTNSFKEVAEWYLIEENMVIEAVDFEVSLSQAA